MSSSGTSHPAIVTLKALKYTDKPVGDWICLIRDYSLAQLQLYEGKYKVNKTELI
jgi:hypothetical protein